MINLTKQLLFIHGAGEGAYEEDKPLAQSLRDALGAGFDVRYPQMPDEGNPAYEPWKNKIATELATFSDGVILVGHSLGASIILKYLGEKPPPTSIAGLLLIATPFWGAGGWDVDELKLPNRFAAKFPENSQTFFYHSRDDEIVPFSHLAMYRERLPQATFRAFDARGGHQFNNDLTEVAEDIKKLTKQHDEKS